MQDDERALHSLRRDRQAGGDGDQASIAVIEARLAEDRLTAARLTAAWQTERTLATAAVAARTALLEAPEDAAKRAAFETARASLAAAQGDRPLMRIEVTPEVVAQVIGDWTGVPVGAMVASEAGVLLSLESALGERITGQDHVHRIIGTGIRAAKAGLKDPRAPIGVFLLVGPSGVGKTETALAVADLMFGGERFLTTVNMSEYQERHAVSRLVGSPPGYVGYGEGGVLTEAVRQRPYSVVLLDEVEKADREVLNLFYQVFDKGVISDGEGREISFTETVIFLTSNLASDEILRACDGDRQPEPEALIAAIRPILSRYFKPALLARMTIVPFLPLRREALIRIANLKLGKVGRRMHETHGIELAFGPEVVEAIAVRCTQADSGARHVDDLISATVLPRIATEVLSRLGSPDMPKRLTVGHELHRGFTFAFSG
jgi:type VI secretion system protein VasG